MKAIQIVVDEALLKRVDRSAKRLGSSRSATIRRLVELGLENEALLALAEAEAAAYAKKPPAREDRAAFEALDRAQKRVLDELAETDRW